ncbi:MAG: aminotransferase class V-fold PLP-dependent enzyme [Cyclobacteriaceae bacterium]|nr:aminotransferase class V-fold PLP-dependent enzyme [Cyclobacteriaceae bacterium]
MAQLNFTPGPSELYFTVPDHLRRALREGIPSLSHRSKAFEKIFQSATDGLRELLGLPAGFHIAFTSSATEVWERSVQSLVAQRSAHLVNGAFSRRFFEISGQLGKTTTALTASDGEGFETITLPPDQELIAYTHNETSTGVMLTSSVMRAGRDQQPEALVIVDAVSSLPYADLDYTAIDSVFFSVQKGFGLPAGLGVWIYNDRCVEKAKRLQSEGKNIGTYHSLLSLHTFALKNQTPETPNVLGIYLLGQVVADFLRRGITIIRKETEYKAALLYGVLDRRPDMTPFVKQHDHRSKTVITVSCPAVIQPLTTYLESKGLSPGEGYGINKAGQLRFANFPAHSKETYELLADSIEQFNP